MLIYRSRIPASYNIGYFVKFAFAFRRFSWWKASCEKSRTSVVWEVYAIAKIVGFAWNFSFFTFPASRDKVHGLSRIDALIAPRCALLHSAYSIALNLLFPRAVDIFYAVGGHQIELASSLSSLRNIFDHFLIVHLESTFAKAILLWCWWEVFR